MRMIKQEQIQKMNKYRLCMLQPCEYQVYIKVKRELMEAIGWITEPLDFNLIRWDLEWWEEE
jgi:hypothetical protein